MANKRSVNTISMEEHTLDKYRSVLMTITALIFVSCFMYGLRPLVVFLIGGLSAYITDYVCVRMRGMDFEVTDISSMVTGFLIALLLPPTVPYWLPAIGSVFAVALATHAFGGPKNQIFNPAAVGFIFLSVTWPDFVYSYPSTMQNLPLVSRLSRTTIEWGVSPAYSLRNGGRPFFDNIDLVLGNYPGPLGATCSLIIVACLVFLIVRKSATWHVPVTFISTCIFFSFLFPRIIIGPNDLPFDSIFYEIFCGVLFYGAVFMGTEPNTTPKREESKIFFGLMLGILTMLFNYFGAYEIGFCFALVIMNALSGFLDRVFTPFVVGVDWKKTFSKKRTMSAEEAKTAPKKSKPDIAAMQKKADLEKRVKKNTKRREKAKKKEKGRKGGKKR